MTTPTQIRDTRRPGRIEITPGRPILTPAQFSRKVNPSRKRMTRTTIRMGMISQKKVFNSEEEKTFFGCNDSDRMGFKMKTTPARIMTRVMGIMTAINCQVATFSKATARTTAG